MTRRRRLAAAVGAVIGAAPLAHAPGARAAEDPGWAQFDDKHYAEAVSLWRAEAERGVPDAELGLGIAYDLGQGVESDAAAACDWYRRAGDDGIARAEFNLAVMRDDGRCGGRDAAEAALWYGRAAARGHARAQYDLAQLYAAGDGVPANPDLARAWYEAASASGVSAAADAARRMPATHGPELAAATPLWPRAITLRARPSGALQVPLVWSSQAQPEGARFYIEVYALSPGAAPNMVRTGYEPRSAAAVSLDPGDYAWRVLTADPAGRRYAIGDWSSFKVERKP